MVVFRYLSEEEGPGSCSYEDLEQFEGVGRFLQISRS